MLFSMKNCKKFFLKKKKKLLTVFVHQKVIYVLKDFAATIRGKKGQIAKIMFLNTLEICQSNQKIVQTRIPDREDLLLGMLMIWRNNL